MSLPSPEQIQAMMDAEQPGRMAAPRMPSGLPSPAEIDAMMKKESSGQFMGGLVDQAAQGATFNLADEATAGLDALYNYGGDFIHGRNKDISLGQQYDAALGARRGMNQEFQEKHPIASAVANVGGGLPMGMLGGVPATFGKAIKAGALLGGAYGFGAGEGGVGERAKSTAIGAGAGGAASGLTYGIGKLFTGAGSTSKKAASNIKENAIGLRSSDYLKSAKKDFLTEIDGEPATYLKQTMQDLANEGAFDGPKNVGNFIQKNAEVTTSLENNLSDLLSKADQARAAKGMVIQPTWEETRRFLQQSPGVGKGALTKDVEEAISETMGQLDGSLGKLQAEKQSLYKVIWGEKDQAKKDLKTYLARDIKKAIEAGVDQVAPGSKLSEAVKGLNKKWGQYITVGKILKRTLADEESSSIPKKLIGAIRTSGGGGVGILAGGAMGGPIGAVAGLGAGLLGTTRTGKFLSAGALNSAARGAETLGKGFLGATPYVSNAASQLATRNQKKSPNSSSFLATPQQEQQAQVSPTAQPTGGVNEKLVQAVIKAESAGNPKAVSKTGAKGLMQLMPAMAKAYGVDDPFDPEQNVRGGTALLEDEMKRFGDMRLALAAYNAGSPAVLRAIKAAGSKNFDDVVQFLPAETQNYVPKVLKYYEV